MMIRRPTFGALSISTLIMLLTACGAPGPPLPPSLKLPKPVADLRAVRKGNTVVLTWTVPSKTTDQQNVRHFGPTRVCRSLQVAMNQCGTLVGEVPPSQLIAAAAGKKGSAPSPVQASYTDTLPTALQQQNPTAAATYAVETLNENGRSAGLSNQVQVPLAPTLPPPSDVSAEVTADGVILTWTGILHEHEAPELRHVYRVYRRQEGSDKDQVAGEVSLTTSQQATFVDHSFEWQKSYDYRATVVTVIPRAGQPPVEVEGEDSPPVHVFANDTFPPANPTGLQAVFSGVGQQPFIDLTWAPNTDADLAGYNVYRREEGEQPVKINTDLVKTPAFRDGNVQSGKKYFYSVSAVDLRGNESGRSEEANESVP
ncbi:MAG TPA: hypothetical protein VEV41_24635 [Terriglobales bacterium]|jgi:hypothetical protein|nr:hypothetical protein [Terriglobales bacterium]